MRGDPAEEKERKRRHEEAEAKEGEKTKERERKKEKDGERARRKLMSRKKERDFAEKMRLLSVLTQLRGYLNVSGETFGGTFGSAVNRGATKRGVTKRHRKDGGYKKRSCKTAAVLPRRADCHRFDSRDLAVWKDGPTVRIILSVGGLRHVGFDMRASACGFRYVGFGMWADFGGRFSVRRLR